MVLLQTVEGGGKEYGFDVTGYGNDYNANQLLNWWQRLFWSAPTKARWNANYNIYYCLRGFFGTGDSCGESDTCQSVFFDDHGIIEEILYDTTALDMLASRNELYRMLVSTGHELFSLINKEDSNYLTKRRKYNGYGREGAFFD